MRVASALASSVLAIACGSGSGNPASAVLKRPKFEPGAAKCGIVKSQSKPLIVEWPSGDRLSLESQMRQGVLAVNYIGCEMEVLRCNAPGTYRYVGTTRQDDEIVMRDTDDLYANIPIFASKFEAKLAMAGQLTVTMSMVGAYESDSGSVTSEQLAGDDCGRATHIISALTAGAFEFSSGANSEVSAGAEVGPAGAGGKSTAKRETLNRAGNRSMCDAATTRDLRPPEGCGAVLRVEVVPIRQPRPAGRQAKGTTPAAKSCPAGTTWNGRSCTAARSQEALTLCKANDVADCRSKCDKGHGLSCARLGAYYYYGQGVPKDYLRAAGLFQLGCEGGHAPSCNSLGRLLQFGEGVAKDEPRAAELYQKACEAGEMLGCSYLGYVTKNGVGVAKNETRAADLFQKACDAGLMASCNSLGAQYFLGQGLPKDSARAVKLFTKACEGGNFMGCANLGARHAAGEGVPKDLLRAATLYQKACDGKDTFGCWRLGLLYLAGVGVPKDASRAAALFKKICGVGRADACATLARQYSTGEGVAKDEASAAAYYKKACDHGHTRSCAKVKESAPAPAAPPADGKTSATPPAAPSTKSAKPGSK